MKKTCDMKDRMSVLQKISECPAEYFDGHTDFSKLTPKERLLWLSSANYLIFKAAEKNSSLGCSRFFSRKKEIISSSRAGTSQGRSR